MFEICLKEDDFSIQVFFKNYSVIFTKKEAGNFSFQQQNFPIEITSKARIEFSKKYNIFPKNVFNPILEHDKNYYVANKSLNIEYHNIDSQIGNGDAILVIEKDLYGMITFADCIPLALLCINKNACASIHLGSKSIIKDVTSFLLKEWHERYDLNPSKWLAIIGPSIFYKDYEVQLDFIEFIKKANIELLNFIYNFNGKYYFDNRSALLFQLKKYGVENIFTLDFNTYEDIRFSSYRKEKPNHITQALFVTFS
ncbi:MAG TPA: laccase domain-containing protein [Exilispira sp.]|nr:laccase domain-containing protein [Exilispira sp.]